MTETSDEELAAAFAADSAQRHGDTKDLPRLAEPVAEAVTTADGEVYWRVTLFERGPSFRVRKHDDGSWTVDVEPADH